MNVHLASIISRYWALKEQILGVSAPAERSQEDLDPPTIFHINQVVAQTKFRTKLNPVFCHLDFESYVHILLQDYDMIRYFTRTILQFQFAEKLCDVSGHTGPLHR